MTFLECKYETNTGDPNLKFKLIKREKAFEKPGYQGVISLKVSKMKIFDLTFLTYHSPVTVKIT